MRVGFIGLGKLGGPMADRLVVGGHQVRVFDPLPQVMAPRLSNGASAATSAGDAARDAEVTCFMVRNNSQALEATLGEAGAVGTAPPGSIMIMHSTVALSTVRAIDAACTDRNIRFIDAAVSTGFLGEAPRQAALHIMCGGDQSAIEEARPIMDCYSSQVLRFGDVGAGMVAKLARNLIHYCVWNGTHEGMSMAEAAGLDLDTFKKLVLDTITPDILSLVLTRDTTQPFDPSDDPARAAFARDGVGLAYKDLDDAFSLAEELGVATPLGHAAREVAPWSMNLRPEDAGES